MSSTASVSSKNPLEGLTVLVTGGTGSLGNAVVRRLMTGEMGRPKKILIFSRDEWKQHEMKVNWGLSRTSVEDLRNFSPQDLLEFHVGDVRLPESFKPALQRADIVIHAAALKQVPQCEHFPMEAVRTNLLGAYNLVQCIQEHRLPVQKFITISTDKACKPVNVMGMTKALQERIVLSAASPHSQTQFMAVRYGNVIGSRGSVIPHFLKQIEARAPITITSLEMTRFLLTLDEAVQTVFEAITHGQSGEIWVPRVRSSKIVDIAQALMPPDYPHPIQTIGIRPGEKTHEILISEEEGLRTVSKKGFYVIQTILAPSMDLSAGQPLVKEYSSADHLLPLAEVKSLMSGWVDENSRV